MSPQKRGAFAEVSHKGGHTLRKRRTLREFITWRSVWGKTLPLFQCVPKASPVSNLPTVFVLLQESRCNRQSPSCDSTHIPSPRPSFPVGRCRVTFRLPLCVPKTLSLASKQYWKCLVGTSASVMLLQQQQATKLRNTLFSRSSPHLPLLTGEEEGN